MSEKKAKFYIIHLIVLIITAACFLMNGPMRGGLPLDNTVTERMVFVSSNIEVWMFSWCIWMLSALGLFVFCAMLASELKPTLIKVVGLSFVAMGIAPDLIAEVIYAFIIPKSFAQGVSLDVINTLEIAAMHLTGFLGNGLYNLGGLLLTLAAWRQSVLSLWVAMWGIISWVLGLGLSLSIALSHLEGAEIFTAISMVLSTTWMLVFAYKVLR